MSLPPLLEWLRPWAKARTLDRVVLGYRGAFTHRREVLADLARLCNAHAETYVPGDPHATAFNEGRRAVWLHIERMLSLTHEDLAELKECIHDD